MATLLKNKKMFCFIICTGISTEKLRTPGIESSFKFEYLQVCKIWFQYCTIPIVNEILISILTEFIGLNQSTFSMTQWDTLIYQNIYCEAVSVKNVKYWNKSYYKAISRTILKITAKLVLKKAFWYCFIIRYLRLYYCLCSLVALGFLHRGAFLWP